MACPINCAACAEQTAPTAWRQCPSMFATRGGAVFCCKREGHTGDHRGSRAQWDAKGRRVSITEKCP